jgi:hypothetical protein
MYVYYTEKKDDEWKVDQQHISKLKEQYEKERKGKKASKFIDGRLIVANYDTL